MVRESLRDALDAFVRMDVDAAIAAAKKDKAVDSRYAALLGELGDEIKTEPSAADAYQQLIWVVRSLERIGDHSKNICEYVIYLVRGRDVRHISIDELERELANP